MAQRNQKPTTSPPPSTASTPPVPVIKSAEDEQLERLRQQMDADDGSPPEMWDPEPGESLVAELVRYEERTTKVGPCRVAVVRDVDTDDLLSVWLSRSVLKNEFEKQSPRTGDVFGLKFHGEKMTRNGQSSYFLYTLRVIRTTTGDTLANRPGAQPENVVVINDEDNEDVPL